MRVTMKFLNLFLIGNLLFPSSTLQLAHASDFSSNLLKAVQVGSQLTNQFVQTYSQNQQSQVNDQALTQAVDAIAVKPIPDRYFPQTCQKLPVQGPDPKNILPYCTPFINQLQLQKIKSAITQNANLYNIALIKGQANQINPMNPVGPNMGVQCLEENSRTLQAQLLDRSNELKRLITELEKQNEIFKRQAEDQLDDMANIRAELDGQNPRAKPNVTELNTEALFKQEPSCQVALRKDLFLLKAGKKTGLKGIQEQAEVNLAAADRVLNEKESWTQQIIDRAKTYESLVKSKGLEAFTNGQVQSSPSLSNLGSNQFGAITTIINNKRDEVSTEIQKIKSLMTAVVKKNGIPAPNIPTMGPNFQREMADQIKVYEQTVKDAHLSGCLNQRTGGGLSTLLGALKQSGFEKEKTASLDYFRRQLDLIDKNSTLSLKEKIAEIENLEKTNDGRYNNTTKLGEFYLFFNDGRRQRITDLLKQTVSDCSTIQTQVTRLNQATTVSGDTKEVKKMMGDLMALDKNTSNSIVSEIKNRLINCEGISFERSAEPASAGGSSCDAQKLTPSSPLFCMQQSSECATHVQRCRKYAADQVASKEAQLKDKANNYNSVMDTYRARQNEILKQIVVQFEQQKDLISQAFPGVKTEVPESLLVTLPPKELNPLFQVGLIGVDRTGNPKDLLADLKAQVKKVQTSMEKQAAEVKQTVDKYTADVAANYAKEKTKWDTFITTCDQQIATQQQQATEKYQADLAKHEETKQKVGTFCKSLLRFQTGPGCAEVAAGLSAQAEALTAFLYPGVADQLERYEEVCSRINNAPSEEESEDEEIDEKGARHVLMQLCDGEEQGLIDALSSYANAQMDKIEVAVNSSLQHDFEEEEEEGEALERTREQRLAYLYGRDSSSENNRESASSTEAVSVQDITRYMRGSDSPLTSQESKLKNTTEGQLLYTIRKLNKAMATDADLKDGKACTEVRKAAGDVERQTTSERGQVSFTSVSEEDMKRRIDASSAGAVRKLRQLSKDVLRVQKELKRKVSQGRTIAQMSGEKVFNSCSSLYNSGRGSSWDVIQQGASEGIQDMNRMAPGVFK